MTARVLPRYVRPPVWRRLAKSWAGARTTVAEARADGTDLPGWRLWLDALDNAEDGRELWSQDYDHEPRWSVTWAFTPEHWAVGLDVDLDHATRWSEGHLWITASVGPFAWSLSCDWKSAQTKAATARARGAA